MSDVQRLAVVVFFILVVMWFVGWFAPLAADKAPDDGTATQQNPRRTRAIGRWLGRAVLILFVVGLAALALAA